MEYQRFVELLERFFARAGTVLHKKGEHFPGVEGSPSFVIIDENRNTYYLAEIGLPDDYPKTDHILEQAINDYAARENQDSFVLKMFTVLGEGIKTSRFTNIDDPDIDTSKLQKKSALVVADAKVQDTIEYADRMGIEYQTVPLKGIFTIFFFSQKASDEIETLYNKVSGIDDDDLLDEPAEPVTGGDVMAEPEEAFTKVDAPADPFAAEEAAQADNFPEMDDPFDTDKISDMIDALDGIENDLDKKDAIKSADEDIDTTAHESSEYNDNDRINTDHQFSDDTGDKYDYDDIHYSRLSDAPLEDESHEFSTIKHAVEPEKDETHETFSGFKPEPNHFSGKPEKKRQPVEEPPIESDSCTVKTKAACIAVRVYSFLLFAPAFIVNRLSKGRVPDAVSYWLAAMCAFFGMYYYPLAKGFGGLAGSAASVAHGKVSYVSGIFSHFDQALYAAASVPENVTSVINTAAGWGVYLMTFNDALLRFINTPYYLKYIPAIALLIAIVPAFRTFGRRMACFLLVTYLAYIPLFILGNISAEMFVANLAGSFVDPAGLVNSPASLNGSVLYNLVSATGGVIASAVTAPFLAVLIALKMSKGLTGRL